MRSFFSLFKGQSHRSQSVGLVCVLILSLVTAPVGAQDGAKQTDYRQAVADARTSMADRDMAGARRHLADARSNLQPAQKDVELVRLDELLDYQTQFWDILRTGVAGIESGEELMVKTARVAVVETDRERIVLKAAGRMLRYRVEEMPTSLVLTIADRCFAKDGASKVAIGSFLLFDKKGDRKRAAQLWREAAEAGMEIDLLMPELGIEPGSGGGQLAVPTDPAKLHQAEMAVKQTFQSQYAVATSRPTKESLAQALLAAAAKPSDNVDARFVALREARDLAAAAGNPLLACEVIDRMAQLFRIDDLAMKTASLEQIAKSARSLTAQKEVAQTVIALLKGAVDTGRLAEARRLAEVGLAAARQSRNRLLMRQLTTAARELEAMGSDR